MKYTFELALNEESFDNSGNIRPNKILSIFEQAATTHGNMLGVSFENMLKKGLLWVVTRVYYNVCGKANVGQQVKVTTWPLAPSRVGYERDYVVSNLEGNPIIKGVSNWALIDSETRKLAAVTQLYNTDNFCEERAVGERVRRIKKFEADAVGSIVPDASMIDRNGHVNNTNYAVFAEKALGGFAGNIAAFQIDYHREVMCGQPLSLSALSCGGHALVKGEDAEGALMFCCSVDFS